MLIKILGIYIKCPFFANEMVTLFYDEGELFAVLLQEDKGNREDLRVYRMVLEIQSTYSMDSTLVERAFSAMACINSKLRNLLASHHFVSCMWMALSATPDRDVV